MTTATGGQAPEFDVQTGSVGVGSREANVALPTLKVEQQSRNVSVPVLEVRPPAANQPRDDDQHDQLGMTARRA